MLEVRGLSKSFGGLKAVDQASLDVRQGEIVGLIGPNGAGKTTLFAAIAGFHKPDAGSVAFDGSDITGLAPHRICAAGMVRTFQITQPFAKLTVHENIAVGAYQKFSDRARAWAHAQAIAEQVGMAHMLAQPASELTVAGRKRLELLDEVMAGLNPSEILEIIAIIRQIRDSGVTVLLIEHVMHAVMSLSDHIHVLSYGKIIAEGSPQQVVSNQAVIEAYLGRGSASAAADSLAGGAHA